MHAPADKPQELRPTVLVLASSDSSGGAGLQADMRAIHAMGAHALVVPTGITVQEIDRVHAVFAEPALRIRQQLLLLAKAHAPQIVKIGLIPTADCAAAIRDVFADPDFAAKTCIVDPVARASSGDPLSAGDGMMDALDAIRRRADLLTPNVSEAEALLGYALTCDADIERGAEGLLEMGPRAVLIKGGHRDESGDFCQDYYADRRGLRLWLTAERLAGATAMRGTGCTLGSAIAALMAKGHPMIDAIVVAKAYVAAAMLSHYRIAGGERPLLDHGATPFNARIFPWITPGAMEGRERISFPPMDGGPIGIYPVVERASWIERLARQGVTTIQLRVKDLAGSAREEEIVSGIASARRHGVRLFINDFWEIAIKHRAYGVHLGQEDLAGLPPGALKQLAAARLRLGVSTHSFEEASRAHALNPSYMALGPIFPTTCKSMAFTPHGIAKSLLWVKSFACPIVAIGGIGLEHAAELVAMGVDGIAVITDIVRAQDPDHRAAAWNSLLAGLHKKS